MNWLPEAIAEVDERRPRPLNLTDDEPALRALGECLDDLAEQRGRAAEPAA